MRMPDPQPPEQARQTRLHAWRRLHVWPGMRGMPRNCLFAEESHINQIVTQYRICLHSSTWSKCCSLLMPKLVKSKRWLPVACRPLAAALLVRPLFAGAAEAQLLQDAAAAGHRARAAIAPQLRVRICVRKCHNKLLSLVFVFRISAPGLQGNLETLF